MSKLKLFSPIESLPQEVLAEVTSYLDVKEVVSLKTTNHAMKKKIDNLPIGKEINTINGLNPSFFLKCMGGSCGEELLLGIWCACIPVGGLTGGIIGGVVYGGCNWLPGLAIGLISSTVAGAIPAGISSCINSYFYNKKSALKEEINERKNALLETNSIELEYTPTIR